MTPDIPPPPPGWAIVPADDARLDCLPCRPLMFSSLKTWIKSSFDTGEEVNPRGVVVYALPIEPAQPWSLPAPPAGQAWHRHDWTADMLPEGWRPLLLGEAFDKNEDEFWSQDQMKWRITALKGDVGVINNYSNHCRTRRPLPASQPEQPTWQAILAEAKAKEATAGANNPLFSGIASPAEWGISASTTDPKGEAGKAKAPLALLPPEALRQAAWAHGNGAAKYGAFSWRENQVCTTTYISAMMRHIGQYLDGEDADAESGLSHLAHVIASANILIDAKHCGTLVDDRPKRPA